MAIEITEEHLRNLIVVKRDALVERLNNLVDNDEEQQLIMNALDEAYNILTSLSYIFQYSSNIKVWKHATDLDRKDIFSCFGNYETVIGESAKAFVYEKINDYFSQSAFTLKELDWFYLDFITAVAYRSNVSRLSDQDFAQVYPNIYSAIQKYDDNGFFPLALLVIWTLIKWVIGIFVLIIMWGIAEKGDAVFGYIAVALIFLRIYLFYRNFNKWNALKKASMQKLFKLKKLYSVLSDTNLHWDLIAEDAKACRDNDLDLPIALHTAIKRDELHTV